MSIDYVAHVAADTARLVSVARDADLAEPVPSCPDWKLADLVWHLTEVQGFWAAIVEGHLDDPGAVPERVRGPEEGLVDALGAAGERLTAALRAADPAAPCWTWSSDQTVGFVQRRQAHEALIHRIDAELTVGATPTGDPELAADGADEILTVMMGGVPDWAEFRDGTETALLTATDAGRSWSMAVGRMVGTSPTSGTSYDLPAIDLRPVPEPNVSISGPALALDRWLWGRGDLDALDVTGDGAVAALLREVAVDVTQ